MLNIQILSFLLILGSFKTKYTKIMCINTNDDNWLSTIYWPYKTNAQKANRIFFITKKTKYTQIICINTKDDNWLSTIWCKRLDNIFVKKSDFNQLNIWYNK